MIERAPPCRIFREVCEGSRSSIVSDFLQRLRLQQLRLKVDLRADPATKDLADEKWLQANAQRLEALDRLSLYFCLGPWKAPTIRRCAGRLQGTEVDWDLQPEGTTCGPGAYLPPRPVESAFWRGEFQSGAMRTI